MKKSNSGKKNFGGALIALGIFLIFYAWSMDVTVYSNIINLGLLDDRRNILLMGIFFIGIGIFLFTSGQKQPANISEETAPESPPCQRDLSLPPYKIWLITRYGIKKNDVLDSFVCQGQIFSTVDSALEYAHSLEIRKIDEQRTLEQQEKDQLERISIANTEARRASREVRQKQLATALDFIRKHKLKLSGAAVVFFATFAFINLYEKYLFQRYFDAQVALSTAEENYKSTNSRWLEAKNAAAKKLEQDEIEKLEVNVEASLDGASHYIKIINHSRYHVNRIEGLLALYSNGLEFPGNATIIKCCYTAIPPGGSDLTPGEINPERSWSGPEMQRFAEKNGIKLIRRRDGMTIFSLDKKARLSSASIELLVADDSDENANPKRAVLRRVDFSSQAEKLPEILALQDSGGLAIIEKRRREFTKAEADWYSWKNIPQDFHGVLD